MLNLKTLLLSIIIFSNVFFAKEFDQLFKVYIPINNTSEIEKSINNSFNIMIYRLSGSESPSNIWKIINAGNTRKDFIKSYSLRNIEGNGFLEVIFNKDYLINVFDELSIPVVGNSRPVILFMINVDSGTKKPYFLSNYFSNNDLDLKINHFLNQTSKSRGIFLELPELDLFNMNEIKNYEKLINIKDLVSSQHDYDLLYEINITKIGPNKWSVTGDMQFEYEGEAFNTYFTNNLDNFVNNRIDNLLDKQKIEMSNTVNLKATIMNIKNYEDYKNLKKVIDNLVGVKSTNISRFNKESIYYDIEVYGNSSNFINEISDSSYISIDKFDILKSEIIMSFES
tara:strand:+ start:289 stop:1308 length:1020 start_codon:yes stop_codon:yes gene_type:complete